MRTFFFMAGMAVGFCLAAIVASAPSYAAEPIVTGRDAMRCVAVTFAADMGPWSAQKMVDRPAGPAMQAAIMTCGVMPYIAATDPENVKMIYSGALAYWMIKD